jgi:hypothetical protein
VNEGDIAVRCVHCLRCWGRGTDLQFSGKHILFSCLGGFSSSIEILYTLLLSGYESYIDAGTANGTFFC